jgi:hypothetical protein
MGSVTHPGGQAAHRTSGAATRKAISIRPHKSLVLTDVEPFPWLYDIGICSVTPWHLTQPPTKSVRGRRRRRPRKNFDIPSNPQKLLQVVPEWLATIPQNSKKQSTLGIEPRIS